MRRTLGICLFACCLILVCGALGEGLAVSYQASANADSTVQTSMVEGTAYLFLPSCADRNALALKVDAQGTLTIEGQAGHSATFASGGAVDITALFPDIPTDGRYPVTITAESGAAQSLCLMFSANIRALFLVSDDPVSAGRAWVDGSEHHETSASGCALLLRADGSVAYAGLLDKIRGRGNSTWGNYLLTYTTKTTVDKKPYQITLSQKTDLLDTGDPDEANKPWILLANYYDGTMLHNRIAYDLARELGQATAPNCQPVDLYYDGVYCGQYLLAEKVEVADGRVDVEDYDKILKKINKKLGIDIDSLPQIKGESDAGMQMAATDGVLDGGYTNLGGYLIELDNAYYAEERAYFSLRNGTFYTITNPEYASLAMANYLSRLFEEIDSALTHYGVSPDTGKSWTDYLDVDSILPYYWVNKLAKNPDAWMSSSTYFVLPEGGGKLSMGPVWDFDQAYYLRTQEGLSIADPLTLDAGRSSWAYSLERIPAFQALAKEFFTQELQPAVENILLGEEAARGASLRSLAWYWAETEASRAMNDVLWNPESIFGTVVADTYQENYANLVSFIQERFAWLAQDVESWPQKEAVKAVEVTLGVPYGNVENLLSASLDDLHTNATQPTVALSQIAEATQDSYAIWQADITVAAKPDASFAQGVTLAVNGTAVPCTQSADGFLTASVRFEDPSYRPAEYDDTDYGLVFDADYYAAHYPDVVAAVGDDPAALLEYYVNTGMAEFQQANAFFDPKAVLEKVPEIADLYGDGGDAPVFYFLDGGYWDLMSTMGKTFTPTVSAAGEE